MRDYCPVCGTVFKHGIVTGKPCPMPDCIGDEIVTIDENLVLVIKALNELGYATAYCCGGHVFDNYPQTYITFYGAIQFDKLPKGFEISTFTHEEDTTTTISKLYPRTLSPFDLQRKLWQTAKDLLAWVETLPQNVE